MQILNWIVGLLFPGYEVKAKDALVEALVDQPPVVPAFAVKEEAPVKPEEAPPKRVEWVSRLTLTLIGERFSWQVVAECEKIPKFFPWKDFYKWYFSADTAGSFSFKHTEGETIIRRVDIVRIERSNWVLKELDRIQANGSGWSQS